MKLLFILFACICLHSPQPSKEEKQKTAKTPKKEKKASAQLAPSILIVNF